MKNVVFLDLDGPMIPDWGITITDDTGNKGRVVKNFRFLSRFHPIAVTNLIYLLDYTNSVIVTNSTHNGGDLYSDGIRVSGADHILNVFKANNLHKYLASPNDFNVDFDPDFYISGYKNRKISDWRAKKDRARGILNWFDRYKINARDIAFVALDDSVTDFNSHNYHFGKGKSIPFVHVGPGHPGPNGDIIPNPDGYLSSLDVEKAIEILCSQPGYLPKK